MFRNTTLHDSLSAYLRLILIGCVLTCTLFAHAGAVAPQRLLVLRGAIALAEGQAERAVADLRQAAPVYAEDWRIQMLYGEALLLDNQLLLAKAQLRRAALLAPCRPEVWQELARAGRTMKDPHLEFAALAGLLRIFPQDPQAQRRMAELYRIMGQQASADKLDAAWRALLPPLRLDAQYTYRFRPATLEELRQLAAEEPRKPEILAALATAEWNAGNQPAARDVLKRVCSENPADPVAVGNYARLTLLAGQVDEALWALRGAAGAGDYTLDRACALWSVSAGRYTDAIAPLERLLLRNPVDTALNRELGVAALMSGDIDKALAALRIGWLKDADHLTAQHYATALLADGRADDAEDVLEQAIVTYPRETMLQVVATLLYRDTDRREQAAQLTAELAKTRPEAVELTLLAGERYLAAGFLGRAHTMASALRDNYPSDLAAAHAAMYLFRRLAAHPDARLVMTRYLGPGLRPPQSWSEILLEIARCAVEDNRLVDARTALEEILKKEPRYRTAYVQLGRVYQQQHAWEEAIRLYITALVYWQNDPEFLMALAHAARQVGNLPLAIATYQKALAANAGAESVLKLGEIYRQLNENPRARACWQQAGALPGGRIRALLNQYADFEETGEIARAGDTLDELVDTLTAERTARVTRWRTLLDRQALAPTAQELDALLLLEPDLVDPAPLLARQQTYRAQFAPSIPDAAQPEP